MKTALMLRTALAAALLSIPTAHAADVPAFTKAPLASTNWSGLYLGAQLGGVYNRDKVTTPGGELLAPVTIHDGSFFAGGYAGYNVQYSSLVLGIEGDYSSILGGKAVSARQSTIGAGVFAMGETDPSWLATFAGRFGLASNNWLLYGKVGGAWMQADYTGKTVTGGGTVTGSQTFSATRNGWLLGAGIEYAWSRNWLSRIEYDYIDFASNRIGYTLSGFNAADYESSLHVVKVGVAYKFD